MAFTPTPTLPPGSKGDANCDGRIDSEDVLALLRLAAGLPADIVCVTGAQAPDGGPGGAPFGGFLDFSGPASGWAEVPDDPALDPGAAITVEAWVFERSRGGSGAQTDCPDIAGKNWTVAYMLAFTCGADTLDSFINGNEVGGNIVIPLGQWVHAAMTYDGTTRRLYVNGAADVTDTAVSGPIGNSSSPLRIGNDAGWDRSPDGLIDEVRIWNIARSQADIQADMNAPVTPPQPGLVAVWHLDGNATDAANAHNGALSGDVTFGPATPTPSPAPTESGPPTATPTASPSPSPSPVPTPAPVRLDIDCDGATTVRDALVLLLHVAGRETLLPSNCPPIASP